MDTSIAVHKLIVQGYEIAQRPLIDFFRISYIGLHSIKRGSSALSATAK
jgi:hypothetical protein